MTKYIYALYASLIVTMLIVVVASAHNIIAGQKSGNDTLSSQRRQPSVPQYSVTRSTVPTRLALFWYEISF